MNRATTNPKRLNQIGKCGAIFLQSQYPKQWQDARNYELGRIAEMERSS